MANDAIREGWYTASAHSGAINKCVYACHGGGFILLFGRQPEPLPVGWTLGPRIDDLLRDAARLNWLIEHQRIGLRGESPKEIRQAIDAEIAREKGP
jgi:hypothetical protein